MCNTNAAKGNRVSFFAVSLPVAFTISVSLITFLLSLPVVLCLSHCAVFLEATLQLEWKCSTNLLHRSKLIARFVDYI